MQHDFVTVALLHQFVVAVLELLQLKALLLRLYLELVSKGCGLFGLFS